MRATHLMGKGSWGPWHLVGSKFQNILEHCSQATQGWPACPFPDLDLGSPWFPGMRDLFGPRLPSHCFRHSLPSLLSRG